MKKRIAILVLVLCAALLMAACSGSASAIVGTWKDEAGITTWEFKQDGTVSVEYAGQTMTGTYKIDGDKLTMTGNGESDTGTFKIEGNKLTLTSPSNIATVLVKQ